MARIFVYWICLLCFPATLISQESEYLMHVQAYYLMPNSQQYQFAGNYYGNFDQEPSNIVLDGMPLSRTPKRIRLQFSIYSKMGLSAPDEVIFNGETAADPKNLTYIINPATWPAQTPLKISLFSNWPALNHWIDIPIIWDGKSPFPTISDKPGLPPPPSPSDLVAKGLVTTTIEAGHAIQVATSSKIPDAEQLKLFQGFGEVYYLHEPPFYKIRIGIFSNKQDALNKLKDIRDFQNGAYADAFYLYEPVKRSVMQADEEIAGKPQDYDTGAYVGVKGLPGTTTPASPGRPLGYDANRSPSNRIYYEIPGISIQLSVHVNPPNLAAYSYLEGLAPVYLLNEKNVYKLNIGPFPSRAAAEAVMPQVQAAGFSFAFIKMP